MSAINNLELDSKLYSNRLTNIALISKINILNNKIVKLEQSKDTHNIVSILANYDSKLEALENIVKTLVEKIDKIEKENIVFANYDSKLETLETIVKTLAEKLEEEDDE